jgi:hypothetical protein
MHPLLQAINKLFCQVCVRDQLAVSIVLEYRYSKVKKVACTHALNYVRLAPEMFCQCSFGAQKKNIENGKIAEMIMQQCSGQ